MKKCFIVANWKSNKTEPEAKEWLAQISNVSPREAGKSQMSNVDNKEVIVCPPFTLLPLVSVFVKEHELPIRLGAQDISPFDEGQYTGEVNGKQLREFCDYVLIGHSERREHFNEDDSLLEKKVARAKEASLIPIFCIQEEETMIPKGVRVVAYEPPSAIGTGKPDTPQNANNVAAAVKEKAVTFVLYGGSVTAENVKGFTAMPHIDGVLIGGASLDSSTFVEILKHA